MGQSFESGGLSVSSWRRGAAAALSVLLCLSADLAVAAKRVALVIGNSAYVNATPLRNPVNDAVAVTEALHRLDFEVIGGRDLEFLGMRDAIRQFGRAIDDAELALFFFAGHGIQVFGRNYLIPIDSELASPSDLDFEAIDVSLVLRQLEESGANSLIFLDSCRDSPFEQRLARSMGTTRSATALGRGLARIDAAGGALIAFATDPGAVAFDGDGDNSPFTTALLNHLEVEGLEVNLMMTKVRSEVFRDTEGKQRPWTNSSLLEEVYLAPDPEPAPTSAAVAQQPSQQPLDQRRLGAAAVTSVDDSVLDLALWRAAEAGDTLEDYEAYLARFPEGAFAGIARNRIARGEAAATSPSGATAAAEIAAAESASTEVDEQALGLTRGVRIEIQERLTAIGFDPRGIDGLFGAGTRDAIRRWQSSQDLSTSGFLNDPQLSVLRAQSEKAWQGFKAATRRSAVGASGSTQRGASGGFRAIASCGAVTGEGRGANAQQAMLAAARACVANGAASSCCANNITVSP